MQSNSPVGYGGTIRTALAATLAASSLLAVTGSAARAQTSGLMYVAGYNSGTSFIDEYSWASTGASGGVSTSLLHTVSYTTGTAPSSVNNPNGMAVGPDGRLYVASVGQSTGVGIGSGMGNSLIAYSADLSSASVALGNIESGVATNQVYWSGNSLYVGTLSTSTIGGRIYKYDYSGGSLNLDTTFGGTGYVTLTTGTLARGLAVSGSTLYVTQSDDSTSSSLDSIRVLNALTGASLTGDNTGISTYGNTNPRGLALVGGNLYITDLSSSTLFKYNATTLAESSGGTPGGYRFAAGGPDGLIYLPSAGGNVDYYNTATNTKTSNLITGLGNAQILAFGPSSAPEPAALALVLPVVVGTVIRRRRKPSA